MARVPVRIPRLLADMAGTGRTITVDATTAAQAVDALCTEVPALRVHVFDDDGDVRRHVNIFVRGEIAKGPGSLDGQLDDGDEVAVVQAVSGGA
ncbi:MAG: MoaD/ThiS family protein [Acidimicrobiales bacterium]